MKRLFLFVLLLCPALFSCQKDEIKIDPEHPLIGLWNLAGYHENIVVYARQQKFSDNPGFTFHSDGTLIVRQNSSFCGTPPITYANYEGNWNILNDTLLQVSSGYWGGVFHYKIDVESVTADSLKVIMISENN
jgi:hypothetical protein